MKLIIVLMPFLLLAESIHKPHKEEIKQKCKIVCDTKEYRQKEISKAIEYYKNAKGYSFSTKESSN